MITIYLQHSAKGSTWENHKYIKRVDGTYYYPDSYEGGRHLPDQNFSEEGDDKYVISETDIQSLAREVIRGNFANGEERRKLLGQYYQEVQNLVNQMLKGGSGNIRISDVLAPSGESMKESQVQKAMTTGITAMEKALKKPSTASLDLNLVYDVYNKRKDGG